MEILLLNWYDILNPIAGGAERYLFEIFSRLASQGHSVTLVCQSFPGGRETESVMGIHVVRLPIRGQMMPVRIYRSIWQSLLYYTKHHRSYDVVVDCVNKVPYFTPLYVARAKRLALQHHFNGVTFRLEFPRIGRLLQEVEKAYFRLVYAGEKFVVVSPSTQADLATYGVRSEQSVLIHNAVDCPNIQIQRSREPSLLYLGRLSRYKSVDLLLRAMVPVTRRIPEARLRVVGHGRDRKRLDELMEELGIESSVSFEGYVSEQKKGQILASAWLHVNPSRKEGWGISVLEAARYGVPSIASRVPGLCDSVKDGITGRLVEYGDVPQLAEAILELLQDHQLRMRMGEQAREFSLDFTWDAAAQQMESHLGTLLDSDAQHAPAPFLNEPRFPDPL